MLGGVGQIMCTTKEAATCLGVNESTFIAFLKREPKAHAAFWRAREVGKISIRRAQWKLAQHSATMAIFLGKIYLGQTDRPAPPPLDRTPSPPSLPARIVAVFPNEGAGMATPRAPGNLLPTGAS